MSRKRNLSAAEYLQHGKRQNLNKTSIGSKGCSKLFICCVLARALEYVIKQSELGNISSFPFAPEVVCQWLQLAHSDCNLVALNERQSKELFPNGTIFHTANHANSIDSNLGNIHVCPENDVQEEREIDMKVLPGWTVFSTNDTTTYWTDPKQFFTWWKNNIERKDKLECNMKDANSLHLRVQDQTHISNIYVNPCSAHLPIDWSSVSRWKPLLSRNPAMFQRAYYCTTIVALAFNIKQHLYHRDPQTFHAKSSNISQRVSPHYDIFQLPYPLNCLKERWVQHSLTTRTYNYQQNRIGHSDAMLSLNSSTSANTDASSEMDHNGAYEYGFQQIETTSTGDTDSKSMISIPSHGNDIVNNCNKPTNSHISRTMERQVSEKIKEILQKNYFYCRVQSTADTTD